MVPRPRCSCTIASATLAAVNVNVNYTFQGNNAFLLTVVWVVKEVVGEARRLWAM